MAVPNPYKDFYGDKTRWFVGSVISINDPLELGRIRVRIYGIHSDNKTDIPDRDLPWAQVVTPITEGGTKGYGSNIGVQVGAEVFGMFLDGDHSQLPLILGSMPKNENTKNNSVSTNLLARTDLAVKHPSYINRAKGRVNDDDGEAIEYYKAKPPKVTSVAPDKTSPIDYYDTKSWVEPVISGGEIPEYPDNHVYETPGGHIMEFDNSPGKERFHQYHPSGSYEEIIATGQRTLKSTGPNYELYLDSASIFIKGDHNVTIGGNITIGDSLTDSVVFNASINSDLIPETDNTYNLGSPTFRWQNLYANNLRTDLLTLSTLDVGNLMFRDNEITTTTGQDLYIDGNGSGGVRLGNFRITGNVITNVSNNAITQIAQTGDGYFRIDTTNGFVPPRGNDAQRPTAYAVVGMTRFNTGTNALEVWSGSAWASPAGASGAVSEILANDIAASFALMLG